MALIKCPECGKEISDKAGKCPNCGYPIEEKGNITEKEIVETKEVIDENTQNDSIAEETPSVKKSLSKKVVISIGVIIAVAILGIMAYFIVTANSRNYDAAQKLYTSEKFGEAWEKFSALDTYKDSKDMVEKCEYNLSVDGRFLNALSKGLMARWDLPQINKTEDEIYGDNTKVEIDYLSSYYDEQFDDNILGEAAKEYIDLLNRALESLKDYTIDYNAFMNNWNSIYAERTMMIKKFVNEYEVSVDAKHQKQLEELLKDASGAEAQLKLKEDIESMMEKFVFTPNTDEWGYTKYRLSMENTTEYTFDYFYVNISVLNAEGNIIGTGQCNQVESWVAGQKAEVDAWVNVDNIENMASLIYTPHYQSGSYYQ